jgi:hypothetical protein
MSVVSPPEPPRPDELEALIREARARQRRRHLAFALVAAAAAVIGLGLQAILAGGGANGRAWHASRRPLASISRCSGDQLVASGRGGGLYTGHALIYFTFRNVSGEPCKLRGTPPVGLVMRHGRHLAAPEQRIRNLSRRSAQPVPVQTVVLRPHGIASFLVVVTNQVGRRGPEPQVFCSWSRSILVTPPGGIGTRVPLRYSLPSCGLLVTPVVAGDDRRYSFG